MTLPLTVLKGKSNNLTGKRFGDLVAVGPVRQDSKNQWIWLFQCDCGRTAECDAAHAKRKGQCGCKFREKCGAAHRKHGDSNGRAPEYGVWWGMIQRCEDKKNSHYKYYGGRGIRICKKWRESYSEFLRDMGRRPSSRHSIDRYPDNNGNYEPGNCRWATPDEQSANRRSVIHVTIDKVTMSVSAWCRRLKVVAPDTAYYRIRHGWSPEQAVSATVDDRYRIKESFINTDDGRIRLSHLAKKCGINKATLRSRIKSGMSLSDAMTKPVRRIRVGKGAECNIVIEGGEVESVDGVPVVKSESEATTKGEAT